MYRTDADDRDSVVAFDVTLPERPDDEGVRLHQAALDPSPELRVCAARRLTCDPFDGDTEALLDILSADNAPSVRDAFEATLRRVLPQISGLERTSLLSRWATSRVAAQRLTAARALAFRFPVLWDDVLLDHLSRDRVRAVRRAARRAAELRGIALGTETT